MSEDALVQRVERMQRAEVERIASANLAKGSDPLTMSGNELAAYLNEETGEVDADRVREDVRPLLEERPRLSNLAPAFDPTHGTGGVIPKTLAPSWGGLFQA